MATKTITLRFEQELINDAARALDMIADALPHRHGVAIRRFEKRFMALAEGEMGAPGLSEIEPGWFVFSPPRAVVDVITEAKRLGLI